METHPCSSPLFFSECVASNGWQCTPGFAAEPGFPRGKFLSAERRAPSAYTAANKRGRALGQGRQPPAEGAAGQVQARVARSSGDAVPGRVSGWRSRCCKASRRPVGTMRSSEREEERGEAALSFARPRWSLRAWLWPGGGEGWWLPRTPSWRTLCGDPTVRRRRAGAQPGGATLSQCGTPLSGLGQEARLAGAGGLRWCLRVPGVRGVASKSSRRKWPRCLQDGERAAGSPRSSWGPGVRPAGGWGRGGRCQAFRGGRPQPGDVLRGVGAVGNNHQGWAGAVGKGASVDSLPSTGRGARHSCPLGSPSPFPGFPRSSKPFSGAAPSLPFPFLPTELLVLCRPGSLSLQRQWWDPPLERLSDLNWLPSRLHSQNQAGITCSK